MVYVGVMRYVYATHAIVDFRGLRNRGVVCMVCHCDKLRWADLQTSAYWHHFRVYQEPLLALTIPSFLWLGITLGRMR